MKRIVAPGFIWFTTVLSTLSAAPARPLYEPPDPPKPLPAFTMAGSYWYGKCYADNFWMIFEEGGTINWGYGSLDAKKAGSHGSWKLDANQLYFEMNGKVLEFRGTMDGQVIQGGASNKDGYSYPTLLRRMPRPK